MKETTFNKIFQKLHNLVLLNKMFIAAHWNDAKRLVRKRLLDFYYISVVKKTTKLKEIWVLKCS